MKPLDYLILTGILALFILYYGNKILLSWKMKKRVRKAKKAEIDARAVLEKEGYVIIESQKRVPIITYLDNKPYKNWVQADFIVKKQGKIFVVEVKTGHGATKITNPATRRQLLEYDYVYRPHGILLLDMEYGKIQEVIFHKAPLKRKEFFLLGIILSFFSGVIITLLFLKGGSFFE